MDKKGEKVHQKYPPTSVLMPQPKIELMNQWSTMSLAGSLTSLSNYGQNQRLNIDDEVSFYNELNRSCTSLNLMDCKAMENKAAADDAQSAGDIEIAHLSKKAPYQNS